MGWTERSKTPSHARLQPAQRPGSCMFQTLLLAHVMCPNHREVPCIHSPFFPHLVVRFLCAGLQAARYLDNGRLHHIRPGRAGAASRCVRNYESMSPENRKTGRHAAPFHLIGGSQRPHPQLRFLPDSTHSVWLKPLRPSPSPFPPHFWQAHCTP